MDYHTFHADQASSFLDLRGKSVLIVGCNTGRDCQNFAVRGATDIHGVDVIETIGTEFSNATYHRVPVQKMELPTNTFDLVYCVATMEHVSDIENGYRQMVRVLAPEGVFYCVAAPLWHSRNGHHKGNFFNDYPWIHLRKSPDEILDYCDEAGLSEKHGRDMMAAHIQYMLNPRHFNKRRACDYVAACAGLRRMEVIRNAIDYEPNDILPDPIYAELASKGYDREDLLGVNHRYIGTKRPY